MACRTSEREHYAMSARRRDFARETPEAVHRCCSQGRGQPIMAGSRRSWRRQVIDKA